MKMTRGRGCPGASHEMRLKLGLPQAMSRVGQNGLPTQVRVIVEGFQPTILVQYELRSQSRLAVVSTSHTPITNVKD